MKHIFRNFWITITRFRMASALNIVGLSIAYAAFMVVMIQISYQLNFDKHYPDGDRIYRVNSVSEDQSVGIVSRGAFDEFSLNAASIESATLISPHWGSATHIVVDKNGTPTGFNEFVNLAWPNFPQFFGMKLVDGDFAKFAEPEALIIPRSIAEKIFGDRYAAGKTVRFHGKEGTQCTVAAVYEDMPKNSQLNNLIYQRLPEEMHKGNWDATNYYSYVKAVKGATAEQITKDIATAAGDVMERTGWIDHFSVCPIEGIYFDRMPYYGDESLTKKGDLDMTYLFFAVGLLVICIAIVNFINFSTSLAPLRMKSINIQKVLGNPTSTLRTMLVGEAVLISFISFLFAIWWVYGLSVSDWQNITEAGIYFAGNWSIIISTGVLSIIVGAVAGIYPAFYTTRFAPALVLKGSFAMSRSGRMLRTVLVGVQFVISIALIISSLFLQEQNTYMQKVDKGFESNQIVVVSLNSELYHQRDVLESELKSTSSVEDVAYSQFRLGRDNMMQGWSRKFRPQDEGVSFNAVVVSWNFPSVMGMKFIAGAPMRKEEKLNKAVDMFFIVNEKLLTQANVSVSHQFDVKDSTYSVIRAAVKDFNFNTLRQAIEPTALVVSDLSWVGNMPFAYIKTRGDLGEALKNIRAVTTKLDPTYPATVELYDDGFDYMYQSDIQTTKLISFFSLLAILISLVGVFGLVVFETQYRRKEIGVRKIMGSTITEILVMFNRKFAVIVGVCFVVAVVAAYFVVDGWLGGFAYRTPMYWWVFALGGVIVFVVTLLIVSTLTYRAATENPVKSLRSN